MTRFILNYKLMNSQKIVIPAKAGIHKACNYLKRLDSRFYGNDKKVLFQTFYEAIINLFLKIMRIEEVTVD